LSDDAAGKANNPSKASAAVPSQIIPFAPGLQVFAPKAGLPARVIEPTTDVELATIAFGYGLSVTALQLANAYQILAADGMMLPISFVKTNDTINGRQIIPSVVATQVRSMLTAVVGAEGTGKRAAVNGYKVAGKTGTVHKAISGGYSEDRYLSLFAGMAPADNPRLVTVVVIDEPQGKEYYGGQVAAPVFSRVMTGALRLMDIPPDNLPDISDQIVAGGSMGTRTAE